jgi:hypothetical protein
MARRRQAEHVVLHETVNHQVHLLWSFELVEVAGAAKGAA